MEGNNATAELKNNLTGKPYDWSAHEFKQPEKLIKTMLQMSQFNKSDQYAEYMTFVLDLQNAVKSKPISASKEKIDNCQNPYFTKLRGLLEKLKTLAEEVKLAPRSQTRFGNLAFKDFANQAFALGDAFFDDYLDERRKGAKVELSCYFSDSFGSPMRIDYGTGHEMNFIILLMSLVKLGFFEKDDYEILVRGIFYE